MTKIYKIVFAVLVMSLFSASVFGQGKIFTSLQQNATLSVAGQRDIIPDKYNAISLDTRSMLAFFKTLPLENGVNRAAAPIMELPMPDGKMAKFRVWQSPVMEPALSAKYPEIQTFAGQGVDDPFATLRMDYNPYFGFSAQVLSPSGNIYIDPYARRNVNYAISYYTKDFRKTGPAVPCLTDSKTVVAAREQAGPCRGTQIYTYRLALACTGEYATAVCAPAAPTTNATLAKMTTSVNRVSGVYEKEIAVRLLLVANTDLLIYLDGVTDPYANNNGGTMLAQNHNNITSIIGTDNFDIGHVFSTGGGGVAFLQAVCNAASKGGGVTGLPNPVGDAFDIDFVAHEMGHQFGANHTFNSIQGGCGGNRNGSTAYEVGAGTTIMAYAGLCGTDDIQFNSDPFFHSISFDEISTFLEAGGNCRGLIATGNTLPQITSIGTTALNIPLNTPFTLTGTATDADGDLLTYSWEEWDLGTSSAWNGGASSTTRPLFKARVPKSNGSRTFPDISVILANYPANPTPTMGGLRGETLPTVAREMKFRLTVRDSRGGVVSGGSGCQAGLTGVFSVNTVAATGPFIVTAPNGGESYSGGSTQTITWNVAGTNTAPISCANVKISMSEDGGLTYPYVIAASTPNDGTEALAIPAVVTNTARIKIEAVGNIFFDISNQNFTVTVPTNSFDFDSPSAVTVACAGPASVGFTLGTAVSGTFTTAINLSAGNLPAGASVVFGTNPLTPGNSSLVTVNGLNTLANGTYTIQITGVAGALTRTRDLSFTIQAGTGPSISTQPTASIPACVGTNAVFTVVSASALSYQWQVSTNGGGSFANVATGGNTASYTVNSVTTAMHNNQYRVLVTGQCGVTTSTAGTLTVQTAPAITTQPASSTLCLGADAPFSVAANGTNLTYQWQLSTAGGPFGNIATANNASYTVDDIIVAQSGNQYRVLVGGTCAPAATSSAATLTVISPVAITNDPDDITQCETGDVSFTVAGDGSAGIIYQWQVSTDGVAPYTNIANGGVYSGATTSTLSLTNLPADYNNYRYRALLSNATCTTPDVSAVAVLTVNARPTVTLSAPTLSIQPGQTTQITASILPSATGFDISWFRNDVLIPGVTGTTYTADVTTLGNYRVDIVNATTGCDNQSQILTIGAAASERLFIFPSPNNGQFTVSYYNSAGANTKQTIAIYDSKGARVYNGVLNVTGPYTLHSINLRGVGSGVFYVVLGDANGKKIIDGKVLIAN